MAKEILKRIQSEIKASVLKNLMLIKIRNTLKIFKYIFFCVNAN